MDHQWINKEAEDNVCTRSPWTGWGESYMSVGKDEATLHTLKHVVYVCLLSAFTWSLFPAKCFPDPKFRFFTSHATVWARDLLHYQGDVMGSWQLSHLLASLACLELPDLSLGPDLWKQWRFAPTCPPTAAWANLCPLMFHTMFFQLHGPDTKYFGAP